MTPAGHNPLIGGSSSSSGQCMSEKTETRVKSVGISVVDGVDVNITVSGDEDRAEKTLMELKEHLGRISAAYEQQTPPLEAEPDASQVPLMTVAWDEVFDNHE